MPRETPIKLKMTSECTAVDEYGSKYVLTWAGWLPFEEWEEEFVKFWKNGAKIAS